MSHITRRLRKRILRLHARVAGHKDGLANIHCPICRKMLGFGPERMPAREAVP